MNEALEALRELGWNPFWGGVFLAILCGGLSIHVVLHRLVFVAAALSQVSAMGIALGLLFGWRNPSALAGVLGVLTVLWMSREKSSHESEEARLGLVYALAGALSILFVSKSPVGKEEVVHLLEGDLLFLAPEALHRLAGAAGLGSILLFLAFPHLVLVGFDPQGAEAVGYRVGRWRLLLLGVLALTVSVGMETGGILMTFAFLVLPALAALALTDHLGWASLGAIGLAVLSHGLGLFLSFHPAWDLPSSASTVAVLGGITLLLRALPLGKLRRSSS